MHHSCLLNDVRSSAMIQLLVLTLVFQILDAHHAINPNQTKVPAFFAFGDSLSDSGNNNWLLTIAKSNFPPYGRDFVDHRATGRFSNGKLATDLIASELGIKEFLPAYLDPGLKPQDLLTGVSFASAGTGYDPLTAKIASVLSFEDQLEMFREYKEKLKALAGEERAANIISKSLYSVCAANNDFLVTYFNTPLRSAHYDLPSYVDFLVQTASQVIQELYQLGARKIGVACIPPIGCVPAQRTLYGGLFRECVASNNQAAFTFNSKMTTEIQVLTSKLPNLRAVCYDLYTIVNRLLQNPSRYGLEEVSKGCCGSGKVEIGDLCNEMSPHTCEDASKYAFWDSVHPTQRLYELVVPELVSKYLSPIL